MIDTDTPEICAARAADPAWQEKQRQLREAASARFIERRLAVGMPVERKKAGERD